MIKISHTLFLGLVIVTTTHGMESPNNEIIIAKEKKNKNRPFQRKSSKKSVSLSSIPEHKEIKEDALIFATRKRDHDSIKFYLNNPYYPNPNAQDLELNTALHHAVMNEDDVAIKLFLNDHRIDASIKNINHKTPRELINTFEIQKSIDEIKSKNPNLQKLEDLDHPNGIKRLKNIEGAIELIELLNKKNHSLESRRSLFARASLDIAATHECITDIPEFKKTLRDIYQKGLIRPNLINTATQNVIDRINKTIENQKSIPDRDLPVSAQLPNYATHDFIMKMIYFRLNLNEVNSTWVK